MPMSVIKSRFLNHLSSYRNWDSTSQKPINLAEAGLYFTGKDDITRCDACGLEFSNWKQEDDPAVMHRTRSPSCSVLAARLSDEEVKSLATDALQFLKTLNCPSSDSKDLIDASSTTSLFKPSFIEACIQTCSRYNNSGVPPNKVMVVDRCKPDFKLLQSDQKLRFSTFSDFPVSAARIVSAISLAKNGFFYTGEADKVRCAYCKGFLHGWEEGDKAEVEHRRHFPRCPFVMADFCDAPQTSQARLVPISTSASNVHRTSHQAPAQSPQFVPTVTKDAQQDACPSHPNFTSYESRLMSFEGKEVPKGQQINVLARAGFFHVGPEDNVRCFQCDGGLKNWQATDEPWKEHKRWFPRCPFVRKHPNGPTAGDNMENEVRLVETEPVNNANQRRHRVDNTNERVQFRVEPREIKARMDTPLVKNVLDRGHSRDSVRQAIEKRLTTTGDDFRSVASLLEAIFTIEEQNSATNAADVSVSATATSSASHTNAVAGAAVQTGSTHSFSLVSGDATIIQKKAKTTIDAHTEINVNETRNNHSGEDDDEESAEKLLEENRQLRESRLCRVCMDKDVNTVFLPCGHLVCCDDCAKPLPKCPICRAFIRGTVRTFLS